MAFPAMPLYDNQGIGPLAIDLGATIAQIWFWIFVEFAIPIAGVLLAYARFSRRVDRILAARARPPEVPPGEPRAAA
jgi:hypothetical protein